MLAGASSALEGTEVQVRIQTITRPDDLDAVDAITARASAGLLLTDVPAAMTLRFQRQGRRVVSLAATPQSVVSIDCDNTGSVRRAADVGHSERAESRALPGRPAGPRAPCRTRPEAGLPVPSNVGIVLDIARALSCAGD